MILNAGILHNEKHPPEQWVRQFVEKVCFFKKVLVLYPYPPAPFPRERGECGAAALTLLGALH